MGAYSIAWIIIIVCALGGAGVLYWLLRGFSKPLIRNLIIALAVVFFVVPAPLPGYPEQLAPAFVVGIFEAFFQIDGAPMVSIRIMLVSMTLAAGLVAASHFVLARYVHRQGQQ